MRPKLYNAGRSRGFTLIEILIAVTVFAIVLGAMSTVLFGAFRMRNAMTRTLDETRPLQQAVSSIRRDLAGIVPPGGALSGALQTPANGGTILPGQISPCFYTTTATLDEEAPWGEVQKVFYALTDSTNRSGGKDLIRAVNQNLLPVMIEEQPTQQVLMSGVQNVLFFFYDGTQWRDSWDSATADPSTGQTNMLPLAIKVQIQLAAGENGRRAAPSPVEMVVALMAQSSTNK